MSVDFVFANTNIFRQRGKIGEADILDFGMNASD